MKCWTMFFCCGLFLNMHAQEDVYYPKYTLAMGYGFSHSFTDPSINAESDYLLQLSPPNEYLKLLSVAYYPFENWGIELTSMLYHSHRQENQNQMLKNELQRQYPGYFVELISSAPTGANHRILSAGFVGLAGISYRTSFQRFVLISRMQIGRQTIEEYQATATIKEMGGNDVVKVKYQFITGDRSIHPVVYSPSVSFGMKITKNLGFMLDVQYIHSPFVHDMHKFTNNSLSNESEWSYFEYDTQFNQLNIGFSLMYEFWGKKKSIEEQLRFMISRE